VCAATLVSAVRIALNPLLGTRLPYIFYFPVTLSAALCGGMLPAWITIAIMAVLTATFVLPPIGLPLVADRVDVVGMLVYIGTDGLVAWIGAKYRTLWFAAEHQMLELQRSEEELEARVRDRTAEVQALLQRLVSTQEEERRRIALDIHDQLGQQMTALRVHLHSVRAGAVTAAQTEHVERTERIAEELDRSIDFLTWDLRPAALDDLGLPAALRQLVTGWSERFDIAADLRVADSDGVPLSRDVEASLYRIVQDALDNVAEHARATHVTVELKHDQDDIVLGIEDNGRGFEHDAGTRRRATDRLGLVSMRERAALAGGQLAIMSAPDAGTAIVVRIPVDHAVG
jgi:signal transduction histidine kinase